MTTKNVAPVRADDDGPELAAIAEQVRPVVDAGKGRALAFEVVRALLMIFSGGPERTAGTVWLAEQLAALARWHERARDVESGEEQKREVGQRLSLLDVAGIADRIASAAWCQARTGQPFPFERAIVLDIATALRRACGCSDEHEPYISALEAHDIHGRRETHEHTATVLLPLLIRDARRLCAAANVDVGPIEAAIARHGGRPS